MEHQSLQTFLAEAAELDDEGHAIAFWWHMVASTILEDEKRKAGGSQLGKAPNIERHFNASHRRYMLKYFWPSDIMRPGSRCFGPEQPEKAFETRFRMPRSVFNTIFQSVVPSSDYLSKGLRPDATGKLGISPLLKVICGLREMSYGLPADLADDLFDVSETTASLCLHEFCKSIVDCFGERYLRDPDEEDIRRIEKQFAAVGFPGCLGCLDCAGWTWKNCPKALQGAMNGKEGCPTLRMEVICDLDLWIWSFQFGLPGVFNDLNILEVSDHFAKVLNGSFPSVQPSYEINGMRFDWFYYLTDGIYPQWKVFVKTLSVSTSNKQKAFCCRQESVRKAVERVFGVLFRQFKILFLPSELWSAKKMGVIAKAAVIIHNMVVESRRNSYTGDGTGGFRSADDNSDEDERIIDLTRDGRRATEVARMIEARKTVADDVKVKGLHRRLTNALIDHIWNLEGM